MTLSDLPTYEPTVADCEHCGRTIILRADGVWIDPEATGDDSLWRECCDANDDDITAPHEPEA